MADDLSAPDNPTTGAERTEADLSDPAFRAGVVSLLGMLAYGELVSFFTVVTDADRAPSTVKKVSLTEVAIREFEHHKMLTARLEELGANPHEAMARFRPALDEWHRRCTPTDWYEGLMKVYAGSTIAADFYAECGRFVDPQTRTLVEQVLADSDHYAYAKRELEAGIIRDPKLAARMALWGRRIVGEALSQAQRAAADNDELTGLLIDQGSGHGLDLAELMHLFTRITEAHTRRMEDLGLSA
ncbi:ferritin-like fold-containing protein [Yimella sp. cx-51]|uniref:ferritin-like fold-containing protein n=1 Tax=Yimella sp. cx-51 TaxID=2770551 RepID=UPI00165E5056|nr:ferritin-like fold-containing protein [Yimella sp. cx-51]MBC9956061.1 hydroxylase [Yimella sp. cx-51]QTH37406.1 hydroxylase [Yimella sp. cx-51]